MSKSNVSGSNVSHRLYNRFYNINAEQHVSSRKKRCILSDRYLLVIMMSLRDLVKMFFWVLSRFVCNKNKTRKRSSGTRTTTVYHQLVMRETYIPSRWWVFRDNASKISIWKTLLEAFDHKKTHSYCIFL